ncbi:hypothetical protein CDAR_311541 [Caerostris darwini]|uniref:Uncharacterized protein n=1 Tax=Caerostris darwini TaxID=1538125 RepID=A0AAV4UTJ5_9ARAC|nr:hypothetical protein CDAR_311541 [Caerostris darwini]
MEPLLYSNNPPSPIAGHAALLVHAERELYVSANRGVWLPSDVGKNRLDCFPVSFILSVTVTQPDGADALSPRLFLPVSKRFFPTPFVFG